MTVKPRKHLTTYAFIDSQNLNLGVLHDIIYKGKKVYAGWQLDFARFRHYLKDKFKVDTAFLFIGNLPSNERLYDSLQRAGYIQVLKPTTSFKDGDGAVKAKGNVDTDIVLYAAAEEVNHYDKAVIVSADGDFLSLYEYLDERGKLGRIVIPNKKRYSQLLNKYAPLFDFVSVNRVKLEKRHHKKDEYNPPAHTPQGNSSS